MIISSQVLVTSLHFSYQYHLSNALTMGFVMIHQKMQTGLICYEVKSFLPDYSML